MWSRSPARPWRCPRRRSARRARGHPIEDGGRRRASAGVPLRGQRSDRRGPNLSPRADDEELTAFEREREERIALARSHGGAGTSAGSPPNNTLRTEGGRVRTHRSRVRREAPARAEAPPGPPRRGKAACGGGPSTPARGRRGLRAPRAGRCHLVHALAPRSIGRPAAEEDRGHDPLAGDVALESNNGTESADEAFIAFLKRTLAAPRAEAAKVPAEDLLAADHNARVRAYAEEGAIRTRRRRRRRHRQPRPHGRDSLLVVPRGVTHLDVAPYHPDGPVLVAAGDKDGNVGLWRVDADEDAAATAERTDDEEGDGARRASCFSNARKHAARHLDEGAR